MRISFLFSILCLICSCGNRHGKGEPPVYSVEKGDVENKVRFTGRVRSENSVLIRSPFDSNLVKLNVSLGQEVIVNQSIAVISKPEDNDRISELIQKKGLLEQLDYKREKLKLKIINNNKEIQSLKRLLASGSISKSEWQKMKVVNALEKKEYKIINSQIVTTRDEIKNLQRRERNSSKTLRSPIGGTITELWEEESSITPGMNVGKDTVMTVIEKFGRYILKGDVSEPDYINMRIGQPVSIKLAYVDDKNWQGKVKSLAPTSDNNTRGIGRFAVNVVFDAKKKDIKTGLEGVGEISLNKKSGVLRVPRSSLLKDNENFYISFPSQKGPVRHKVEIGLIGDMYAEVTEGLQDGSLIYKHYVSSQ